MSSYKTATYSGTGEQTMIEVNPNHVTSIAVVGAGGDSYDIQYQLKKGGTRYTVAATQSGTTLQNLTNPVAAVGLDIDTVATTITIEVATGSRG